MSATSGVACPASTSSSQLDEPSLPTVLAGRVRSMSGLNGVPAAAPRSRPSRCCARWSRRPAAPVGGALLRADPPVAAAAPGRRARGVGRPAAGRHGSVGARRRARRGARGRHGAVRRARPGDRARRLSDPAASVDPVRRLWRRLGLPAEMLSAAGSPVVVTPTCGLAGAEPRQVPARAATLPGRGTCAGRRPGGMSGRPRRKADRTRRPTTLHRHAELAEEIDRHRFDYYVRDAPTVSDGEYDALMRELEAIEERSSRAAHARLADPDGRRHVLHRVHGGRPPRADDEPRQRVLVRRADGLGRAGRARRRRSRRRTTCASSRSTGWPSTCSTRTAGWSAR